ncbi:UDP-2,3-diacylglucosamine diphosphatase [Vibrio palustris]|uniref:UDP-2,3-diacylglucosamine hydrolase n=1 Tax=Vibrio palustris TaxID=1918946 RepID=A0A1R4B6J6_9VIBR|nr:UDP-2,3-diacylglucosamine diphosphatase [Vibrio palustris]SJL84547.1 UDP-2,3-diacylglucosamine hydrolase [Vibrio palustris]
MTSSKRHCHAIWLSDLHLGEKHCRAEYLLKFLQNHESQYLFLVGDIVDMQALRRRWHWPKAHQKVYELLLNKAKQGTKVVYIPGNHDIPMRRYDGESLQDIEIHKEYIYHSPVHGRLLLLHGDIFDRDMCASRFDEVLGDYAYDVVLGLNSLWNYGRRLCGRPYQSVARTLKQCSKKAETAMERFRQLAVQRAQQAQVDGIVCGHIHNPELGYIDNTLYMNTGDWVENCTAILEHKDGRLELCHFSEQAQAIGDLVPHFESA